MPFKLERAWSLPRNVSTHSPYNLHCRQLPRNSRYTVAFISRNVLVKRYLRRPPTITNFEVDMFTTIHGHNLAFHDIILLDNGLAPYTLENYITWPRKKGFNILSEREQLELLKEQEEEKAEQEKV